MGRKRRSHLPGAVFHLTSRTQGREPWFTSAVRTIIVGYLAASVRETTADLLAYAIMPNHIHLVLRQGDWPLWRFMQPLLRRISLLVQRSHGLEGHVFERRYRDHACMDPDYLRNAVVYTHLNPVRANLVEFANQYAWSSHAAYLSESGTPAHIAPRLAVTDGLRLFSPTKDSDIDKMRATYAECVRLRRERDMAREAEARGEISVATASEPTLLGGDSCWSEHFALLFRNHGSINGGGHPCTARALSDLGDIAVRTLTELGSDLRLDQVRSVYKGRAAARARREIVRRMSAAGHTGSAIARYLRVSDQCVSSILRSSR